MTLREMAVSLLGGLCDLYIIFIFIRALSSWFRYDIQMRFAGIINFTARLVDPAFIFIRRIFPYRLGAVDLSPVLLVICVMLIKQGLVYLAVTLLR